MATTLFDLARVTVASAPGTGTITLGPAVPGFLTFALSGVLTGNVVRYAVKDGLAREVGYGTYSATGPTLTRNVRKSTNGDALLNLSAQAIVSLVESSEDILSFTKDQTSLFTDADRAIARANLGLGATVAFSAHRNNVTQTGILAGTYTKLLFTNETFDDGGYFNTSLSRWIPPPGIVFLGGTFYANGVTAGALVQVAIFKNNVNSWAFNDSSAASGNGAAVGFVFDKANGTDYYELWLYAEAPAAYSVNGQAALTFFSGAVLK